jgi:hypothetical protein
MTYIVRPIEHYECKEWLLYKHYARRMPQIVYSFGLFENEKMVGICTFGFPPTIFFNSLFKNIDTIELNRLVVNDGLPKNTLSFFVSRCLNILPDFVVVSYADPNQNHHGYIYQATNWIYTGMGRKNIKDKRGVNKYFHNGKEYHERHLMETMKSLRFLIDEQKTQNENWVDNGGNIVKQLRKHRYFFVTGNNRTKKKYRSEIEKYYGKHEYPKGENKKYDSSFVPTTQIKLF